MDLTLLKWLIWDHEFEGWLKSTDGNYCTNFKDDAFRFNLLEAFDFVRSKNTENSPLYSLIPEEVPEEDVSCHSGYGSGVG
jgi:hypothetical protein